MEQRGVPEPERSARNNPGGAYRCPSPQPSPRKRGEGATVRMEPLLVSFGLVALAEMGDKTQLLALLLASRFRRPWPIVAGIFAATLANHLGTAAVGLFLGFELDGPWLKW